MSTELVKAVLLFYCYAHEDELLRDTLEKHLTAFKRMGQINSWYDRQIQAGTEWQQEIEIQLNSASLILLLISPDFIHSDACDSEMQKALALHRTGRAHVIPILLRPVIWEESPIADLQLLPVGGKPITTWRNRDEAFRQVAQSIGHTIRTFLALPALSSSTTQTHSDVETQKPQEQPQPVTPSSLVQELLPPQEVLFEPRNPYKGLRYFIPGDASDFFGREHLISVLLKTLQTALFSQQHVSAERLLTIVGPSGSGKSSVVLAGLIPSLQRGALPESELWVYLERITPGLRPLESLARTLSYQFPQRSLASLQEDLWLSSGRGLHLLVETLTKGRTIFAVLYIDQLEELFTQTLEDAERAQFIHLLLTAITEPGGKFIAVLSMRADFFDRPMHYPALFHLMQSSLVPLLPLDHHDLRDVIRKPAALPDVRLRFEDDLVGELLLEMRGQSGALPLLQFTLDRLFQYRQGQVLTLSAYHEMHGIKGALAQLAEATYTTLPTDDHRRFTRALFLRLVEPGALDQDPTRRRAALSELILTEPNKRTILEEVVAAFTSARLLTTTAQDGASVVEVSHEVVIRAWTRLAEWVREAHEDIYLQKRIREDAVSWIGHGHSVAWLYRGDQLEEALAWKERSLFSIDEEAFLDASVNEQEREKTRIVERQHQEARQRKRFTRRTVLVGLSAGVGLAVAGITINSLLFPKSEPPRSLPYAYQGHRDAVYSVAWSPNGNYIASASLDKTVQVWEAGSGQTSLIYTGHTAAVSRVAWSPDGNHLASAGWDKTVRVWEASSGQTSLIYTGHTNLVTGVAWSPDGKYIASAGADKTVRVWEVSSGRTSAVYTGHTSLVADVAWSPDGKRLASASWDMTVQIWLASNGQSFLNYTSHTDSVRSIAWSPKGKYLASAGDDKTVRVWDGSSGNTIVTYTGHSKAVECAVWSPDGKRLASASLDKTVQIWEATSGASLFTYSRHTDYVISVAWAPNGQRLASASQDRTVQVWVANIGRGSTALICTGHTGYVNSVAWSPDGQYLASASEDMTVQVWDASSGRRVLTYTGHLGGVESIAWSPDGQYIASAGGTMEVWEASSGRKVLTYAKHTASIADVAWSPDGKRLASVGLDGMVRVWDASSGNIILTYFTQSSVLDTVMWSPDGKYLASAGWSGSVWVGEANSNLPLLIYTGHTKEVMSVAWSPDSKYLASASFDRTVQVWNARTGLRALSYTGHTDALFSVAWSPNGQYLASAGADETIQVWLWL